MSTEYYSNIRDETIKELTPFDFKIELVTWKRGRTFDYENKLFDVQTFKIMKHDIPNLIRVLKELEKK